MSSTFIEETLQRPNRIINQYNLSGAILRDEVKLLCSSACNPNPEIARAGISAIFTELVERLNDAFNPEYCILYDNVFSQVIDFFRKLPDGKNLDEALNKFGIYNEEDMLRRKCKHIVNTSSRVSEVKKIILLSRVTIGADVAVISIAISKLRKKFPEAEYVILGSAKLRELFGGDPLICIRELKYERGGTVISRLNSWLSVIDAINDELRDVADNQYLIIDPDSRLTQLGLLPVVSDDRNYYFFESRKYNRDGFNTIAELMSSWIGEIFSIADTTYPFVALLPEHIKQAESLTKKLRGELPDLHTKIVTVSFGTGDNPNKRVSEAFEIDVVNQLLADNVAVILDKGASQNERDQVNSILAQIPENFSSKIITWDGSIGVFAALIKSSDGYIGYDSSGQHIAAALGVPVLTIFVNYNTPVFAERWRPFGYGYIKTMLMQFQVSSFKFQDEISNFILKLKT